MSRPSQPFFPSYSAKFHQVFRLKATAKLFALPFLGLVALPFAGQADTQLKQITVTSSTIEDKFESDADIPASTTVISGEAVEAKHATNLIEVLRSIPGITADLEGDGDGIKIKIRGVDNQRYMGEKPGVAIVIDGVPVFERTGSVNVDLDNIETIRVVKGGASYLFGEDALAGAVIITTKRGAKHEGFSVEFDAGSHGYTRKLVRAGVAEEDFAGHVQVSDRHSDGYYHLSEKDEESVSGSFEYYIDDSSEVVFGFEKSERFRDNSGSVTGVTAAKEDPTGIYSGRSYTRMFNVDLSRLNLSYSNDFSDTGNVSAIVYQYKDVTDYWSSPIRMDLEGPVGDEEVDRYSSINYYDQLQRGVKLEARDSFGDFALMGGLELKKNTFDSQTVAKEDLVSKNYRTGEMYVSTPGGTVRSDSYREEETKAVYTEAKFAATENTTLTANYRVDMTDLNDLDRQAEAGTGYTEDSFTVHSWRLGADHNLSEQTSIYGSVSTGFRLPTLSEMENNPDLEPEENMNYEIGMRSKVNLFGWDTNMNSSVFYIDRKDFITHSLGQYVNSSAAPEGGELESVYENIGHTSSKGLELALQTEKKHDLSFGFAYTYMINKFESYDNYFLALGNPYGSKVETLEEFTNPARQLYYAHYDNGGNFVPRSPKHMANLRMHWYPSNAWTLTSELGYRGSFYADEMNIVKIESRTILNLGVEYKTKTNLIGSEASNISLFAKVDNVLDKDYYAIARGMYDRNYDGVYNEEDLSINVDPGRVYLAGVKVKF